MPREASSPESDDVLRATRIAASETLEGGLRFLSSLLDGRGLRVVASRVEEPRKLPRAAVSRTFWGLGFTAQGLGLGV